MGNDETNPGSENTEKVRARSQQAAVDAELVRLAKEGDEKAFGKIIETHWRRIYDVAYHVLNNPEDAEEVTQDTFLRAHRNLQDYRGEASVSTWLYQIAINLARNRYWYWWRRKREMTISLDEPVKRGGSESVANSFASTEELPDTVTVTQELVDRISKGMGKLNAKHREVLVLRNVNNLSYEEIATILGLSVGTVKSRIARARENLRKKIRKD